MKTLKIHCLQHASYEDPGCIADWASAKGHQLAIARLYENETLPSVDSLDWLIIMGGPMSANDEAEIGWMTAEKRLISEAISANKMVIGICLGAQLIASVLGGKIKPNMYKEIGWFPITAESENPFFNDPITVFHWHGETFTLPDGAILLASSAACKNQAFAVGENVLGLQFHLEVTAATLAKMITFGKGELDGSRYVQSEQMLAKHENFAVTNRKMYEILNHFETRNHVSL